MENLRIPSGDEMGIEVKVAFQAFLKNFTETDHFVEEHDDFEKSIKKPRLEDDYMLQITNMVFSGKSTLYVDFKHIMGVDYDLAEAIEAEYSRFEPYLRYAVHDVVANEYPEFIFDRDKGQREFFVSFYNQPRSERIRDVTSDKMRRLFTVTGTVIRTSAVRPELYYAQFMCLDCQTITRHVEQQYRFTEPRVCRNPHCNKGNNSFQLMTEHSTFVDWQCLRVQENPDEIPPGSIPRCIDVICRGDMVETAKSGDKVIFTGTVAAVAETSGLARVGEVPVLGHKVAAAAVRRAEGQFNTGVEGLKVQGVKELTHKLLFVACGVHVNDSYTVSMLPTNFRQIAAAFNKIEEADNNQQSDKLVPDFSPSEKAELVRMRNTPHFYHKMASSICPSVFGHEDVKRGILLMLFGGVHKKTPEGISLRGDLNVCIVGDPSCAKSQFLKYVHGCLPRTVYTSGKSSSAAGLTASVVRDSDTGEFCVEAGALMLADNGICCIDEFDKMDPADQVALHEAMEQQTISITKAGIQATLNARTSILAAANPVFGRYDRTKTLKANVAVSAAIMSRFDLFFVILDECDPVSDDKIARHIINMRKDNGMQIAANKAPCTREQMQKYIQYARCVNPIVTKESKKVLVECYRLLRSNDILGKNKTAYRMTIRQLESLIRLSEALARLHLDKYVQPAYVYEAYRLLEKSVIHVDSPAVEMDVTTDADAVENEADGVEGNITVQTNDGINSDNTENSDPQKAATTATTISKDHRDITTNSNKLKKNTKKRERQQEGGKLTISSAVYNKLSELFLLRLRHHENKREGGEMSGGSGDDDDESHIIGCQWSDLVAWYLQEVECDTCTVADFEAKRRLANCVIRHMIYKDGSVIVVENIGNGNGGSCFGGSSAGIGRSSGGSSGGSSGDKSEQKMLRLHPSHAL